MEFSEIPKHLHIAEQEKEVQEARKALRARPLDWLFQHVDVDDKFYLVHATHANSAELKKMVKAKATVVLCPSTEANLGDGFFAFEEYSRLGGKWLIGGDSHIGLNPLEELRWLDYGARLRLQRRNPLCQNAGDDSGAKLFAAATKAFRVGDCFDAVVVDPTAPLLAGTPETRRLSTLVFAGDISHFKGTIVRGKWRARDGKALSETTKDRSVLQAMRAQC